MTYLLAAPLPLQLSGQPGTGQFQTSWLERNVAVSFLGSSTGRQTPVLISRWEWKTLCCVARCDYSNPFYKLFGRRDTLPCRPS